MRSSMDGLRQVGAGAAEPGAGAAVSVGTYGYVFSTSPLERRLEIWAHGFDTELSGPNFTRSSRKPPLSDAGGVCAGALLKLCC